MSLEEEIYFEIKDAGDYLRVVPVKLGYTEKDWGITIIDVNVIVNAFPFNCNAGVKFTLEDFIGLYDDLEKLNNDFSASLKFSNFEYDLQFSIQGDSIGQFTTNIQVFGGRFNSQLDFELRFDQSYISEMLRQLYTIIKKFKTV